MTVSENSYALDDLSIPAKGMTVVFGGSDECESLGIESEKDNKVYS